MPLRRLRRGEFERLRKGALGRIREARAFARASDSERTRELQVLADLCEKGLARGP